MVLRSVVISLSVVCATAFGSVIGVARRSGGVVKGEIVDKIFKDPAGGNLRLRADDNGTAYSATVHIRNKKIDASFDPTTGVGAFDGHGQVLDKKDVHFLQNVAKNIVNDVRNDGKGRLGASLIALLSKAPVGYVLDRKEFQRDNRMKQAPVADGAATEAITVKAGRQLLYWGEDGTQCICPGYVYTAYFDDAAGNYWQWNRQAGGSDCLGRCGAGCNWFDSDYMVDCFEHDSCTEHLGGTVLGWNSDCGDEWHEAIDDYIVTYGSYCPC